MIRWIEAILAAFLVRGEIIDHDLGGYIGARAVVVPLEWVEIRGVCGSACTMHLAHGCIHPGATLIFHGPQTTDPAAFDHWSAVMARHYPPAIAAWFMQTGRYGEWTMTGATAIAWGARGC